MTYDPYNDKANPVAPRGFVRAWAANQGGVFGVYVACRSEASATQLARQLPTFEPDIGPWTVVPIFVPEKSP